MRHEQGALDKKETHAQIAEGVVLLLLKKEMKESDIIMPVPFDGYVMDHLLHYASQESMGTKFEKKYGNNTENAVYASSKKGLFDTEKFKYIAGRAGGSTLRPLDFRTKTCSLGRMIRKEAKESRIDNNIDYTVLYDPTVMYDMHPNADTSVFNIDFPDESKKYIRYVDEEAYRELMPRKLGGRWKYPDSDRVERHISGSMVVREIKMEIHRIITKN